MKVLLLCEKYLSDFDEDVIHSMMSSSRIEVVGALINNKPRSGFVKKIKGELRKGRGGYVLIQIINSLLRKLTSKKQTSAEEFFKHNPIKFTETLYLPEVYDWIRHKKPDCLFLRGFGIIREPILSISPYGVLSYHHGDLSFYRGGPPAFWELFNKEDKIGVTIQVLDEGLDTGTIVLQKFFPLYSADNWSSAKKRIYDGSIDMAREALHSLMEKGPFKNPVGQIGKLYTLPNFTQWMTLQLRILKRKIVK